METNSIISSLFLADISVILDLALLSLSFLYLSCVFVWDSSSNLEVINSGSALFSRRFSVSGLRTSPVVRGRSVSGISYRGRSLKKQDGVRKAVRVVC